MFEKLIEIFLKYNSKVNLSSLRTFEDVKNKHIKDSLEINKIFQIPSDSKILDIGTGGGFPMLPLAISSPRSQFIGLDSKKKKVDIVNQMIKELNLTNAEAIRTRIENYKTYKKFDYITARAVGYVDKLIFRSYNLLKKGGYFVFYKKESLEEYEDLKKICSKKNMKITKIHKYKLFEKDINRVIFIIKK